MHSCATHRHRTGGRGVREKAASNWQLAFVFELRSSIPIFKTLGLHGTRSDGFMPKST
jgi:hypothetical protein